MKLFIKQSVSALDFGPVKTNLLDVLITSQHKLKNDLVEGLLQLPNVNTIKLHGRSDVDDFVMSRFRKHLPNLTTIDVDKTTLELISGKELLRCVRDGITFRGSTDTFQLMEGKVNAFDSSLHGPFMQITKDRAKDVLDRHEKERKGAWDRKQVKWEAYQQDRLRIQKELLRDWEERPRDHERWVKGPKTEKDWPVFELYPRSDFRDKLHVMYVVTTQLDLWEEIALINSTIDIREGGSYSRIMNHPAVEADGHSGFSGTSCFQVIYSIAVKGFEEFKNMK